MTRPIIRIKTGSQIDEFIDREMNDEEFAQYEIDQANAILRKTELEANGTGPGNLYGLAWSHPNAGGQAGFLSDHGLIHMMYGTAFATISTNIWCRGDIIAFSDLRVKTNIEVIQNAVDKVMAIRGVTFNRTDFDDKGKRYAGVIAQEVLEVLPEVVTQNEDNGHYSVSYGNISALLIEAIKEQQQQILELKEEIKKLKGE
jgi:hypothetical protein